MSSRRCTLRAAMAVGSLLFLASTARAAISIEPAFVITPLDRGTVTEAVTVKNQSSKEGKFRARVHHFVYSIDGAVHPVDPDEHSLAPWVKLNPKEFTLGPNASRVVRAAIIPPKGLPPGEYWAALEFEPLEGVTTKASDQRGRDVKLKVLSTVYVPVIGTVGEATHQGEFGEINAYRDGEAIEVVSTFANTGTGRLRVRGRCELFDASGTKLVEKEIGLTTVLPGSVRRFKRSFEGASLPPGAVLARVEYSSDGLSAPVRGEGHIQAAPPPRDAAGGNKPPDGGGVSSTAGAGATGESP